MDLTRETVGLLREFRGKKGVPALQLAKEKEAATQ